MMEDTFREWGEVFTLNDEKTSPQPSFNTVSPPLWLTYSLPALPQDSALKILESEETLSGQVLTFPTHNKALQQRSPRITDDHSLAIPYFQQRIIDPPSEDDAPPQRRFGLIVGTLFVLVVIAGGYILHLKTQQWRLNNQISNLTESVRHEKATRYQQPVAQSKTVVMQGKDGQASKARLYWNTNEQNGLLYMSDLPKTEAGQILQLWFFTNKAEFIKASPVTTNKDKAELTIDVPIEIIEKLDRLIVSLEPPGEYPFPMGEIVLRGFLH